LEFALSHPHREATVVPSDTVKLDFPARPEYLPVAAACVTQIIALAHHVPHLESLAYDIQLAVQEAALKFHRRLYAKTVHCSTGDGD
jgi:hypothetical protein